MSPVPFEELDRSPWPKETTAHGYLIHEADAEDLAFALGPHGPFREDREWNWRGANPHGAPLRFAARHVASGSLHALFELLPLTVRTGEMPSRFARIGAAWQAPSAVVAGTPPLLLRVIEHAFRTVCGPDAICTVFGIPGFAHQLLGRKPGAPGHALGYEVVRGEMALVLEADGFEAAVINLPEAEGGARRIEPEILSALAARLTVPHHGTTERDADYLRWRFLDRPDHDYLHFGVGPEEAPEAAAIVRKGECASGPALLVAEWLVGAHDYDAGLALLRHLVRHAMEAGLPRLVAALPETQSWFHHLQWHGLLVHPLSEVTLARTFRRVHDIGWCRTAWVPAAADLDLA